MNQWESLAAAFSSLLLQVTCENLYQYYKSCENPYQVLQVTRAASERAMGSYDKIIITIAPSYTGYHLFVAIGIVTHSVHS